MLQKIRKIREKFVRKFPKAFLWMNNRQNQSLVEKFEDLIIYKNFQIDDVLEKRWLEKFISFQKL